VTRDQNRTTVHGYRALLDQISQTYTQGRVHAMQAVSRSHAPRGNAALAAPAARIRMRRWRVATCSHAGAWEPENGYRELLGQQARTCTPIGATLSHLLGCPALPQLLRESRQ
jgi:hypothetical protein